MGNPKTHSTGPTLPVPSGGIHEYNLSKLMQPLRELDTTDSSEKRSEDIEAIKAKVDLPSSSKGDLNIVLKQKGIEWLLKAIEQNQEFDVDQGYFIPITPVPGCSGTIEQIKERLALVDEITIPKDCIQSEAYAYIERVYSMFELERPVIILDNK